MGVWEAVHTRGRWIFGELIKHPHKPGNIYAGYDAENEEYVKACELKALLDDILPI
jgi:hypothetical protein